MEKNEAMEKLVKENEDFIHAPKFGNSLNKFLAKVEKYPENASIGKMLLLTEEQVEELYQESIKAIKEEVNPE